MVRQKVYTRHDQREMDRIFGMKRGHFSYENSKKKIHNLKSELNEKLLMQFFLLEKLNNLPMQRKKAAVAAINLGLVKSSIGTQRAKLVCETDHC